MTDPERSEPPAEWYRQRSREHPTRVGILGALDGPGASSTQQLSRELGLPLSIVVYHVRFLAKAGLVKVGDDGAVESYG